MQALSLLPACFTRLSPRRGASCARTAGLLSCLAYLRALPSFLARAFHALFALERGAHKVTSSSVPRRLGVRSFRKPIRSVAGVPTADGTDERKVSRDAVPQPPRSCPATIGAWTGISSRECCRDGQVRQDLELRLRSDQETFNLLAAEFNPSLHASH